MTLNHRYSQDSPGDDVVDLRDVVAERDRILRSLEDAGDESYDAVKAGEIDAYVWLDLLLENEDVMLVVDLSNDDLEFVRDAYNLGKSISGYADLDEAADNEPMLILDDYFTEWAKELAEDTGALKNNAEWPNQFIDWEAAADALKEDFEEVTYGGKSYFIRG